MVLEKLYFVYFETNTYFLAENCKIPVINSINFVRFSSLGRFREKMRSHSMTQTH